MASDRPGVSTNLGKKTWVAGGTRLPKETSGGGGKGSGKPTKPKDVELPFGSGKANTMPKA